MIGFSFMGIILLAIFIGIIGIITFVVVANVNDNNKGKDETLLKPRYKDKK